MEYNPLDLLASAAELQQKHDDTPEKTVVTRRRYNSAGSKLLPETLQKENKKEIANNNNNSIKSKGPVVIRKIKVDVNPELEKMLNEHNYGNAKRSQRYEKGIELVLDNTRQNRERTESVSDSFSQTTDITIESPTKNTVIDSSQSNESECKCGKKLSEEDSNTEEESCNCVCLTSTDKLAVNCSKCNHSDCECPRLSQDHVNRGQSEVNSVSDDKIEGQMPDKSPLKNDSINVHSDKSCSQTEKCMDTIVSTQHIKKCDNIKLNDDISPSLALMAEGLDGKVSFIPGIYSDKIKKSCEIIASCDDKSVSVSIDSINDVKGNDDTLLCTINNNGNNKVASCSTSDIKKMPYVKVIPAKVAADTEISKPQTLVINIRKRGQGSVGEMLQNASSEMLNVPKMQKTDNSAIKNSSIGIIRSLLTTDTINNKDDLSKVLPAYTYKEPENVDISSCDLSDLGEKFNTCDTLKRLEMAEDLLCTDSSSTSVHLLSPDRRNPDSVSIAESPVIYTHQDSSSSVENDSESEKRQNTLSDTNKNFFSEISENDYNGELGNDLTSQKNISEDTNEACLSCEGYSNEMENINTKVLKEPSLESKELIKDSRLGPVDNDNKRVNSDNSANGSVIEGDNEVPIFRYESDHCYAGLPGKINDFRTSTEYQRSSSQSEVEEVSTPLGSVGELSQDSGYEDVTQSPVTPDVAPPSVETKIQEAETVKNLVPVLISVDSNGCLTVHKDTNLTKGLGGQIFAVSDNSSHKDSGIKLLSGTNLSTVNPTPLILSPVGKTASPVLLEPATPHLAKTNTENILGLLHATSPEANLNPNLNLQLVPSPTLQASPPKFGKFRIGTYASFSNTGMGIEHEDTLKLTSPTKSSSQTKTKCSPPVQRARSNGVKSSASPVVDTLSTLVQKVKSSLSSSTPSTHIDNINLDHIQHDHDYCLKNLMPSVVSNPLETKLQGKESTKGKLLHSKVKKGDSDSLRTESKIGKRKRTSSIVGKEEEEMEMDDDLDISYHGDFIRPKTRAEKYIEQKSSEPKVKITGSSNFKDQFVYFMNTKKRNRRRESRDSPLPVPLDRVFIPPKPGDIVVPHLTDQDIENLKLRSRQSKHMLGLNSLRNEFMASKMSNSSFTTHPQSDSTDDEKSIINTILSMENENLSSPVDSDAPYNESMEMYGQGLGGDILNLLPEQMNLTQEQMDILLSAVDEVQNSSPNLIGAEKLATSETEAAFTQFPIPPHQFDGSSSTSEEKNEVTQVIAAKTKQTEPVLESSAGQGKGNIPTSELNEKPAATSVVDADRLEEAENKMSTSSSLVPLQATVEPMGGLDTSLQRTDYSLTTETPSLPTETPSLQVRDGCENNIDDTSKPPRSNVTDNSRSCDSVRKLSSSSDSSFSLPTSISLGLDTSTTPSVVSKSPFTSLTESVSPNPSVKSLLQAPIVTPSNISNSLNTEISLPSLDRSSLDLLGNEFRLQTDLFPEATIPVSTGIPAPTSQSVMDYSAPWIVTVSMYWNDLPAIMMKNQPFVRLVDIHKQILPAKDTGILKKRCQLMGVDVENCSEMQRYFLVQYGRAFNSKSTLIISKDDAKELIGYYVDPQPKSLRYDDHKSIIDHRREQLRRIALARRAAMRARRVNGKKEEEDPRAIKDMVNPDHQLEISSPSDASTSVEVPRVLPGVRPVITHVQTPGVTPQRSTRHKKINFLEMLRGDSTGNNPEDENTVENEIQNSKKQNLKRRNSADSTNSAKKKKKSQDKKIKMVKYTVETDSEETESNSSESDFSSSENSDTTSETEIVVVKKPTKKPKVSVKPVRLKSKPKFKVVSKRSNVKIPPLKVKFATNHRRSKPVATSTPLSVQVVSRSSGTLTAKTSVQDLLCSGERIHSTEKGNFFHTNSQRENLTVETDINGKNKIAKLTSELTISDKINQNIVNVLPNLPTESIHIDACEQIEIGKLANSIKIDESDLKVTLVPPEEILEGATETKEMETNTDFDSSHNESIVEKVNESTNTSDLSDDAMVLSASLGQTDKQTESKSSTNAKLANIDNVNNVGTLSAGSDSRSQSPILSDVPHIGMKRKEVIQINSNEVPLRILHRDSSPKSVSRTRSQLGEIFVERYNNKKSQCIRCYTCRKMMSVDNFMRHLHDMANGGLIGINDPRKIDPSESELNQSERKLWETFQRKKELFDNNLLPSPNVEEGIVYTIDCDPNLPKNLNSSRVNHNGSKSNGPRVITTPVSPINKKKTVKSTGRARAILQKPSLPKTQVVQNDGVRSSGRKRKMKQLYPFEEYTFAKFPRLQNGTEETNEIDDPH